MSAAPDACDIRMFAPRVGRPFSDIKLYQNPRAIAIVFSYILNSFSSRDIISRYNSRSGCRDVPSGHARGPPARLIRTETEMLVVVIGARADDEVYETAQHRAKKNHL